MLCNETFRPATAVQTVDYPPVAAWARFSDEDQRDALFEVGEALAIRFDLERRWPYASISFAAPIYYEDGNPAVRVVPDFFVSFESDGKRYQTYKLWEERKTPDFVLDVAAAAADGDRDWRGKPDGYAAIGVPEYWRFDPTGQHFEPRLQGFRRQVDGYAALPANREGSAITIRSETLDLDLHFDGERLRLQDSQTGRFFRRAESSSPMRSPPKRPTTPNSTPSAKPTPNWRPKPRPSARPTPSWRPKPRPSAKPMPHWQPKPGPSAHPKPASLDSSNNCWPVE